MKPRITSLIRNEDGKIISISIKDTVKKLAGSGYIALPRELIGYYAQIELNILGGKK